MAVIVGFIIIFAFGLVICHVGLTGIGMMLVLAVRLRRLFLALVVVGVLGLGVSMYYVWRVLMVPYGSTFFFKYEK